MERIYITDTTLRDGEQAAGISFSEKEKVVIAQILDQVGVHEIECGIPAMGPDERKIVTRIAGLGLTARVISWNRAVISDIETSIACGIDAVAISLPVSDFHICHKLGKTREWILNKLIEALDFAKDKGLYVCVGAEDASRAETSFLSEYASIARAYGADRLRYSDTLGKMHPFHVFDRVSALKALSALPIEIHTHNDFGLATANALAGVKAGAEFVGTTVLGLGERAGNAALEETAMALHHLCGIDTGLNLSGLRHLCEYVSRASGRRIPAGKPIVGSKIFSHESEIHAAAVIKNPRNYEPYPPETVEQERKIALGKYSGRQAVMYRLRCLGVEKSRDDLADLVFRVRKRSGRVKRELSDAELLELCR